MTFEEYWDKRIDDLENKGIGSRLMNLFYDECKAAYAQGITWGLDNPITLITALSVCNCGKMYRGVKLGEKCPQCGEDMAYSAAAEVIVETLADGQAMQAIDKDGLAMGYVHEELEDVGLEYDPDSSAFDKIKAV